MILGMVGWRGMVGSVLMGRMLEENDFAHVEKTIFFSTSAAGAKAPMSKAQPKTCRMPRMWRRFRSAM